VLQGILALKTFAWEAPFTRLIHSIRQQEKKQYGNSNPPYPCPSCSAVSRGHNEGHCLMSLSSVTVYYGLGL